MFTYLLTRLTPTFFVGTLRPRSECVRHPGTSGPIGFAKVSCSYSVFWYDSTTLALFLRLVNSCVCFRICKRSGVFYWFIEDIVKLTDDQRNCQKWNRTQK